MLTLSRMLTLTNIDATVTANAETSALLRMVRLVLIVIYENDYTNVNVKDYTNNSTTIHINTNSNTTIIVC